ncbi:MAG TPA: type II secretion system protein [Actinomycetota bacterium]|nr:type II secretion system protein [Actinomycetota bacterium]
MTAFSRRARDERGFTLVETLASMLVFSIVTIGIIPLVMSSMRASTLGRSRTVGKDVASQSMERMRGLPYFISYASQNRRVDVLDLYYPQYVAAGVYTTTCTTATTAQPWCPKDLPQGYSVTFDARFVSPDDGGSYTPATVPTTYVWNSTSGNDVPPSDLVEMAITSRWTTNGVARSYQLKTLLGDRKFAGVNVSARASIDYGIQLETSFVDPVTAVPSELLVVAGRGESRVGSRVLATAHQRVEAADVRLVRAPTGTETEAQEIGSLRGATSVVDAPPDATPLGATATGATLTHTGLSTPQPVAGINNTQTSSLRAAVAGELPAARGSFLFESGSGPLDVWMGAQAVFGDATPLHLFDDGATRRIVSARPRGGDATSGTTSVETFALSSGARGVASSATVDVHDVRVLPTTFITGSSGERSVVVIEDFAATASCKSTANVTTPTASATWTATLRYWRDTTDNGILDGGYSPLLSLSGASATDQLDAMYDAAAADPASNPLVYDGATAAEDVYLFDIGDRNGYLDGWSSLAGVTGTASASGTETSAVVGGALRINTVALDPSVPESSVSISLGKLACEAVDRR